MIAMCLCWKIASTAVRSREFSLISHPKTLALLNARPLPYAFSSSDFSPVSPMQRLPTNYDSRDGQDGGGEFLQCYATFGRDFAHQ